MNKINEIIMKLYEKEIKRNEGQNQMPIWFIRIVGLCVLFIIPNYRLSYSYYYTILYPTLIIIVA
jgi:hypothetical protein